MNGFKDSIAHFTLDENYIQSLNDVICCNQMYQQNVDCFEINNSMDNKRKLYS